MRTALHAKVPEIALVFWMLKLLSTGMGEAMSDFLGSHSIPIAAAIGIFGFAGAIWLQLRRTRYEAVYYWFAVMMVAVFGTMAADGIHDGTGVSYTVTTPLFAAVTGVIFLLWYRKEGTLSIHSITTRRREQFYWAAVLATFALGTAAGDLTALSLGIGFFDSVILFGVIICIPALAWWRGKLNPIVAFWAAYVVTRPLGASFADWFSKPAQNSGLGLGDGLVSAVALVVFVALVAYVAIAKPDIQPVPAPHRHPRLPHPHPHPHPHSAGAAPCSQRKPEAGRAPFRAAARALLSGAMSAQYIFTTYKLSPAPSARQGGADRHLAVVLSGRQDRRARLQRRRQVDACSGSWPGSTPSSTARPSSRPTRPSACSSRSPSSTPPRTSRATSRRASPRSGRCSIASTSCR